MKKKFLLLTLMTVLASNAIIAPVHAAPQEDVGYAALGGLVLGAFGSWAITYMLLNKKHEKELIEKEEEHQKTINKFHEDIKSLNEFLMKHNDKAREFFGTAENAV